MMTFHRFKDMIVDLRLILKENNTIKEDHLECSWSKFNLIKPKLKVHKEHLAKLKKTIELIILA